MKQQTLEHSVRAVGIGLHSGKLIEMTMKPAAPGTGIVFLRTDLNGASVKADIENIDFNALQMATTLRSGDVVVQTTEHLLSALYASGIDNVVIELNGAEVPVMDGSSAPFLVLIEEAGVRRQAVSRKTLRIEKTFRFEYEGKTLIAEPADSYRISYEIHFDHPLIQRQQKTVELGSASYESEIAPARTFGFLREVNYLKSKGLIRGGSLDNAVVLDTSRILNDSLRLDDEFVSHKILDLIGDFAVAGFRFQGHFSACKAGHEVHAHFMRALLRSDCYSIVTDHAEPKAEAVPFSEPLVEVA